MIMMIESSMTYVSWQTNLTAVYIRVKSRYLGQNTTLLTFIEKYIVFRLFNLQNT